MIRLSKLIFQASLLLTICMGAVHAQQSPRAVVNAYIEAYNRNDVNTARQLVAPDFVRYSNLAKKWEPMPVDTWAQMWTSFGVAFPDFRWEVQSMAEHENIVVVEVIEKGTFMNAWVLPNKYRIRPTGKAYESRNAIAFYVEHGLIQKYHQYAGLGFLQVGLGPIDLLAILYSGL